MSNVKNIIINRPANTIVQAHTYTNKVQVQLPARYTVKVSGLIGTGSSGTTPPPPPALLTDLVTQVNAPGGPEGGTTSWALPVEWKGKRLRVIRNGSRFYGYTIISGTPQDTLQLVDGSVFMGEAESGAGLQETFSFENY